MEKVLLLAMGLCGVVSFAQTQDGRVGVNTTTPKATMDINAIASDNAKGVMVPRLTTANVKDITPNLTAEQHSMLAFFTETFPVAERTGAYIFVAEPGYYYWTQTGTGTNVIRRWERLIVDLRMVGTNNHITQDAGVGGIGTSAGSGSHNVGIGKGTLNAIASGANNFAVGENALRGNTANHNVAIGSHAMIRNTTGSNNTALGSNALRSNSTGGSNVAIGTNALGFDDEIRKAPDGTPVYNRNIGSNNVAVGSNALYANRTGERNFGLGDSALKGNTTGNGNIAVGVNALSQLETGKYNIAMGDLALERLSGDNKNYNIAIGYNAGLSGLNNIGGGVIILGNNATANTDLSFTDVYKDTSKTNNAVALGNFVDVGKIKSNTIVIGNDKATGNTDGGTNVGIGVYEPKAKLDVNGGIKITNDDGDCDVAKAGTIRFNTADKKFQGCDGTGWVNLH